MTTTHNAAHYLVHKHVEAGNGARVAVKSAGAQWTYEQLSELVHDLGAALRGLGMRRDDRVLLVAADETATLASIVAAFHTGLVAVPVSTMLNAGELGKIIADSGARLVICTQEFTATVAEALQAAPTVEFVVHTGDAGPLDAADPAGSYATHDWDSLVAHGRASRSADSGNGALEAVGPDDWALWLYTSGTTGLPKAAMHRHANIHHVCETYGNQILGIGPEDVTFSVAKLFFAYGIGNSLFFPLAVGATTVLDARRPSPAVVQERMAADRPTLFFGVPTFYAALIASDLPDNTFASVRWATSAGEPLPAPLQSAFTGRFGVEILDGIGSTEALHIFLSNRPGDIRPGTTGLPVPGYDVEVRTADGAQAEVDEPGNLYVRGESVALGYWRRADATRQVFEGQWLSTGDTYVRDADGYFRCLGRNSDMLKAGGIWVSPAEVESRLLEHAGVREAAVVGVADENGLDKPVAVVVADDVSAEDLISWCRAGLAHFKAPRQVVFVDELPKTATGKLQRFKVRALMVEQQVEAAPTGAPA